MPGRVRTNKKLAQRINLDYFKTLHGIPRWRRILSAVVTLLGVAWLGWYGLRGSPKPYNAGPVAQTHAMFTEKCSACHVSSGGYQRVATDQACLACHDGPIHNAQQTFQPACSDCHVEHRGAMRLASTSSEACAQCHADLKRKDNAKTNFVANIHGFDNSHPEFAPLRAGVIDPGTIKFNHYVHLKKELRAPHGTVQLQCVDCHRPAGVPQPWPYGEAQVVPASLTIMPNPVLPSRAYMEPVNYMEHCSACHTLQFDRRFQESVPHKDPKIVYDFVVKKLTEYIAAHPSEVPLVDEPDKRLPTRPPQRPARSQQEWVSQRLADAQLLVWRKDCKECHSMSYPDGMQALPAIAKPAITTRWLPHSNFDHNAHEMLACKSCHAKAESSKETSDVLIPGIQTCKQCHHEGGEAAEARCFECHSYHDWGKEKQVHGTLSVKDLVE